MKNLFISLFVALLIINIQAQDTALLNVQVNNELGKPISGEQIIFAAQNKGYSAKGATNKLGVLKVKLVGGLTYNIQVKTIGEAETYNTIKIPLLGKGQKYAENSLTITIFEAKTFTLDNVYFDSGKSTLQPESDQELNELFNYLSIKEDVRIQISGHTDNIGDEESNYTLSKDRSKAVQDYLVTKGINISRIEIKAYGEANPIFDNATAAGRAKNRRIEILVL